MTEQEMTKKLKAALDANDAAQLALHDMQQALAFHSPRKYLDAQTVLETALDTVHEALTALRTEK